MVLGTVEACCVFWEAEKSSCSISQLLVGKRMKQLECSEKVTNTTQKNLSQVNRVGKKDSAAFVYLNNAV